MLRELTFLDTMHSVCGDIVLEKISPHHGLSGVLFSGFCTDLGLGSGMGGAVGAAPRRACCSHVWSSCRVWKLGLFWYGFRVLLGESVRCW